MKKENRLIRVFWVALVAFGMLMSGMAMAKPPRGPGGTAGMMHSGKSPLMMIEQHADELGIDEATLERIWEVADRIQPEARKLRRSIKGLKKEIRTQMDSDAPDRTAVMQLLDQIGELQTETKKLEMSVMLDIHPMLTGEQREALRKFRKKQRQGKKGY